jgi:hypothetical protein
MWSGRNTWYINPPRIKIEGYGKSAKKSPVHNSTALIYDTKWEQNTELVTKMSGHYVYGTAGVKTKAKTTDRI